MLSEHDLLERFASVQRRGPDNWVALCPAHEDTQASLGIARKGDRWMLHCYAACAYNEVREAAGLEPGDLSPGGFTVVDEYPYVDEDGQLQFTVERRDPKDFRPRRPDGTLSLNGVPRVLYRLPQVLAAVGKGETVYVVEGEKDVDALVRVGVVATCNPGGAGKWRAEYSEHLRGADVVIVADRDEAGYKHAEKVAAALRGVAASVRTVEAARGKDAADHLANGRGVAEFVDARKAEPIANGTDPLAGRRLDLPALLAAPPEPTPWRVEDLVADATLTVLSGESGTGKSWLAQAVCLGVAAGTPVVGLPVAQGKTLYVDAEMGTRQFVDRLRNVGATGHELDCIDASGLDLSKPRDRVALGHEIERENYQLVVLDSLRRLAPSRAENDSDDMAPAVGALATLARETGAAIILVHHRGRGDGFYRGSSAIRDQCDALLALVKDERGLRLCCQGGGKMRYAPEPEDVWLTVDPFSGGVSLAAPGAPALPPGAASRRDEVKADALAALPAMSMREVARKLGRHEADSTLIAAWRELRDGGEIVQVNGAWSAAAAMPPLGSDSSSSTAAVVPTLGVSTTAPQSEVMDAEPLCDCGARLTQTPRGLVCIGCEGRNGGES